MSTPNDSLLSVVIATPDKFDTIRRTIEHLTLQTARTSIEIVIVASSREALRLDESQLSRLRGQVASVQIVEVGTIRSAGRANAAGVRRASAPIVALAEDHCFPEPHWAGRLIEAHTGPWAAVGPAVRNANPRSAVSWADLFIGYGPWLSPAASREAEFLPGHNSSYKRDLLLAYGPRLESMMEAETLLHWDLRRNGHRLYLDASAQVAHTNFSKWASWLPVQFHNGRLFAAARARGMSRRKRVVFVAGAPIIPALRLVRTWNALASAKHRRRFLACVHVLAIGLILDGAGQMVGYALGAGRAINRIARYEFHRFRHIRDDDRRDLSLG